MWRKRGREGEKRREEERGDLEGGVGGGRVGNKGDGEDEAAEGKCVNDAAPLRNASGGRPFMPQVSNTVDVNGLSGNYNALRLILMCAANSLGNTLSIHNIHP